MQHVFDLALQNDYDGSCYMCASVRHLYIDALISLDDFQETSQEICDFISLIIQVYLPHIPPVKPLALRNLSIRAMVMEVLDPGTYKYEDITSLCENIFKNWDNRLYTLLTFMADRGIKPVNPIWDTLSIDDLFKTLIKHKFYCSEFMCHSVALARGNGLISTERYNSVMTQITSFLQASMDTLGLNLTPDCSTSVTMLLRHEAEWTSPILKMCAFGAMLIFSDWGNRHQIFNLCHVKILEMNKTAV